MFCEQCKIRSKCNKICPPLNKYLSDKGIHAADWIRPQVSIQRQKDGRGKWREIPASHRIYEQFRPKT